MADFSKYINNGSVNRVKIVDELKKQKIANGEFESLIQYLKENNADFKSKFDGKRENKKDWTPFYLDYLSNIAVTTLNEDYLRHVKEVSEYIKKTNSRKLINVLFIVVGLLASFGIGYLLSKNLNNPNNVKERITNEIEELQGEKYVLDNQVRNLEKQIQETISSTKEFMETQLHKFEELSKSTISTIQNSITDFEAKASQIINNEITYENDSPSPGNESSAEVEDSDTSGNETVSEEIKEE